MKSNFLKITIVSLLCSFAVIGSSSIQASASELDKSSGDLSSIQAEQIIDDFNNNKTVEESSVARAGKRVTFKRGGALAWSKDVIDWNYSNGSVTSSSAYQDSGFIFPNVVRTKGITKYSSNSSTHYYRGRKMIGAGVVTPWGDVVVHEQDITDHFRVTGSGNSYWD